jgi:hypothetical protein
LRADEDLLAALWSRTIDAGAGPDQNWRADTDLLPDLLPAVWSHSMDAISGARQNWRADGEVLPDESAQTALEQKIVVGTLILAIF